MMYWIVYILYSTKRDRYYIGYTGDNLAGRIRKHNSNHKGFTGGVDDWVLKYTETYDDKSEAQKRELLIKSWKSRKRIELLVRSSDHSG